MEVCMEKQNKLKLKDVLENSYNFELYKVVDFLNKNLKDKSLIFGLSKKDDRMNLSVYEI
jgi:hypothetical protein